MATIPSDTSLSESFFPFSGGMGKDFNWKYSSVAALIGGRAAHVLNYAEEGKGIMIKRVNNRPGGQGRRNAEEISSGSEIDSSGRKIREVKKTAKGPKKVESRGQLQRTGVKRPRSQSEERDSTREPARGRAEFTGQMNKRVTNRGSSVRVGKTAAKGVGRGESR